MASNSESSPGSPHGKPWPGPSTARSLAGVLGLTSGDILHQYMTLWHTYGDTFRLNLGAIEAFVFAHPEHLHHILVRNQRNYIKGVGYDGLRLLTGDGLLTSEGDLWRQQRRVMQPDFTPRAVNRYLDLMVGETRSLLQRWSHLARQQTVFEMDREMMALTMGIISRSMFGVELGAEMSAVGDALHQVFAYIPERTVKPLSLPLSWPLPKHRRFHRNMEIINGFIEGKIREGREKPGQGNLLAILLQAHDDETGYTMSESQLRDEVVTLFFAGFETTARTLTWIWYLLSRHPQALERLQAEADGVLGARSPTADDLAALTYTRMVVDESLRLYPPTALLARQNVEEDEIAGYRIPANSLVTLLVHAAHRHPEFWPQPERFDPQRFTPEAQEARAKAAYIPFANGPRICLGNSFALLEMTLAVAMVARRFHVQLVSEPPIDCEFHGTTRPARPVLMRVQER